MPAAARGIRPGCYLWFNQALIGRLNKRNKQPRRNPEREASQRGGRAAWDVIKRPELVCCKNTRGAGRRTTPSGIASLIVLKPVALCGRGRTLPKHELIP